MRLVIPIACLIIVAVACGSDGPSATPDPASVVGEVPLTLAEMPGGWHETPAADDLESNVDISAGCDIFDPAAVFPGALATARSVSFQGPSDQQSQSFAAIYPTAEAAQAAIAGTHDIAAACESEFKDTIRSVAEDQLRALGIDLGLFGRINVDFGEQDEPSLGDASAGYRVQVTVKVVVASQKYTLDYRVFSVGRIAAATLYATFGDPDAAEEEGAIEQALVASADEAS